MALLIARANKKKLATEVNLNENSRHTPQAAFHDRALCCLSLMHSSNRK